LSEKEKPKNFSHIVPEHVCREHLVPFCPKALPKGKYIDVDVAIQSFGPDPIPEFKPEFEQHEANLHPALDIEFTLIAVVAMP
jgi:hypothetical protein